MQCCLISTKEKHIISVGGRVMCMMLYFFNQNQKCIFLTIHVCVWFRGKTIFVFLIAIAMSNKHKPKINLKKIFYFWNAKKFMHNTRAPQTALLDRTQIFQLHIFKIIIFTMEFKIVFPTYLFHWLKSDWRTKPKIFKS